jgi:hypothetical protein
MMETGLANIIGAIMGMVVVCAHMLACLQHARCIDELQAVSYTVISKAMGDALPSALHVRDIYVSI